MSVARRAHDIGKLVFTTVKAEFQKKSENTAVSLPWKLQTVSASIDLMVWTAALQEEQGTNGCTLVKLYPFVYRPSSFNIVNFHSLSVASSTDA